jgi:hypothetical protein
MLGSTRLALALLAPVCLVGVPLATADSDIVREGIGERRAALDKLELTDFDRSLWSKLTDWTNGDAMTPEAAEGKVIVIYTWASYLNASLGPIPMLNRLLERHAEDGLVVVGVHDDQGWDQASSVLAQRRGNFPIARDPGNAFRAALKVDQDPDFYLIDRSGRLRYADIETGSVERGVSTLLAESTDQARGLLTRMAEERAEADEAARRSQRLRGQIDLANLPWVPFAQPSEEEYTAAAWPRIRQTDPNRSRSGNAPEGPVRLALPSELDWRPNPPENIQGRATLLYLFTPEIISQAARAGFNAVTLFQWMDQLQAAHARDLQVVGVMISPVDPRRGRGGNTEDPPMTAEKAGEHFETIVNQLPVKHIRVNDFAGQLVVGRITPNNGMNQQRGGGNEQVFAIPYHILLSSDGVVRWHGFTHASTARLSEWEAALQTVLRVDPGINARKAAEKAYIRARND